MRRLCYTPLLVVLTLVGCRNQPTGFTNPFLAPDRVPPPATRVLTPGTAQPYYPGDQATRAPANNGSGTSFTPAPTFAPQPTGPTSPGGPGTYPSTAPPATTPYAPAPGYGVRPSGAWQSDDPVEGQIVPLSAEVIRVPEDQGRLRFAGDAPLADPPSSAAPAAQPSGQIGTGQTTPAPPFPRGPDGQLLPDPSILPTPYDSPPPFSNGGTGNPELSVRAQPVELRAVAPAAYRQSSNTPIAPPLPGPPVPALQSADGFRPQGALRRRESADRTPGPRQTRDDAPAPRFAHDGQYQWLRGQLERTPADGQWRIRYLRADQAPDALGGSVILANPQVLGNLEPGDFVVVRGQLHNLHYPNGLTTAAYQMSVVQRQR